VFLKEHSSRVLIPVQDVRNMPRHFEAGPLVVQPDRLLPECLLCKFAPTRRGSEGDDRVRMGVVDVRGRDEGVKQGFDRRSRLVRSEHATEEIVDHCSVVHSVALTQREDLVQTERCEALVRDGREIGAGAFDP
jgi:hypothetical protein